MIHTFGKSFRTIFTLETIFRSKNFYSITIFSTFREFLSLSELVLQLFLQNDLLRVISSLLAAIFGTIMFDGLLQ